MPALARLDDALFRRLHRTSTPRLDRLLPPLSRAANHGVLWIAAAGVLAATGSKENRRAALRGITGLAAASAIANGPAKLATRRHRPSLENVLLTRQVHRQPITTSFPSGHSASAAAFATGVALERPVLGAGVAVVAGAVGLSRVHTGVHFPSDVVAGLALGTLASLALTRVWPVHRPVPERHRAPAIELPALPEGAGLTVVTNAGAGDGGADALRDRIAERLPAATVREVGEGEDLTDVLAKAAAEARVLGMAGGDGSINAAARAALDADVPLLVIPAGTLNHFAGELGISSLDEALDAVAAGTGALIDVASAHDADGSTEIFLNNASIGAYPEMVAAREQLEERLGKWPAMVVALARILHRSDPLEVEIDGVHHRLWLLFAGNCQYSPPGFAPSWRDSLDDGLLDLRLIDATRPYSRTRLTIAVLTGRLARTPVFTTRTATQVEVRSRGEGVRLARDGEVGEPVAGFALAKEATLRVYRS